jgi:hypothetical protein
MEVSDRELRPPEPPVATRWDTGALRTWRRGRGEKSQPTVTSLTGLSQLDKQRRDQSHATGIGKFVAYDSNSGWFPLMLQAARISQVPLSSTSHAKNKGAMNSTCALASLCIQLEATRAKENPLKSMPRSNFNL